MTTSSQAQPPTRRYTAALCQMTSGTSVAANLARAERQIADAAASGASLVCLPEVFHCMTADTGIKRETADAGDDGAVRQFLASMALEHKVMLAGGSYYVAGGGRLRNRSLLVGPDGAVLASYDKIHLFQYDGAQRSYDETVDVEAGSQTVSCATGLGRLGLSICYDLRFPELYRRLDRPDVILVPSAFTRPTGQAHWETLLRARAIENQCYVLAAAQCGEHGENLATWGHSMAIDPWGRVIGALDDEPAVLLASIDFDTMAAERETLPALANRRL